jgi:hypothetical protein
VCFHQVEPWTVQQFAQNIQRQIVIVHQQQLLGFFLAGNAADILQQTGGFKRLAHGQRRTQVQSFGGISGGRDGDNRNLLARILCLWKKFKKV